MYKSKHTGGKSQAGVALNLPGPGIELKVVRLKGAFEVKPVALNRCRLTKFTAQVS